LIYARAGGFVKDKWKYTCSPKETLFRENSKALRFDALIDKEEFMYKSEYGHNTPYSPSLDKELTKSY
jgi:hypothetical protein